MFYSATVFNQNLCAWGNKTNEEGQKTGMFSFTDCEEKDDPALMTEPKGPFCYSCISPTASPTKAPTAFPTKAPITKAPTVSPTKAPTAMEESCGLFHHGCK
jgi:hypothetical protein